MKTRIVSIVSSGLVVGPLLFLHAGSAVADPPRLEAPAVTAPSSTPVPESGRAAAVAPAPNIRRDGPPREMPDDPVGPPPGPDYFFVPGVYAPSGAATTWRPGFWTRSQPGWEWLPARWVRQADGWAYREGHWVRAEQEPTAPAPPRRHVVARPAPGSASPFRPEPAPAVDPQADPNALTQLAPLPDASDPVPPTRVQPPAPDTRLNPSGDVNPGPVATPPPPPPGLPGDEPRPGVDPRLATPILPLGPPITELNFPGVHIRVTPPVPWMANGNMVYPPVVVPPVQVRVGRPLLGVRQMVRDLVNGALP